MVKSSVRTKPLHLKNPDKFRVAMEIMQAERQDRKWNPAPDNGGGTGLSSHNVLVGCIKSDNTRKVDTYPCHKPILSYTNAEILWSCFGWRCSEEAAKFFHNWLCYESPWSRIGIVPQLDKDFMFEHGFVFKDLDKTPGNVLHNFLVASRMASEWGGFIQGWYETIKNHKTNPELTLIFTTLFVNQFQIDRSPFTYIENNAYNRCVLSSIDKYDWPLDTGRCTERYVLNFCTGKPVNISNFNFSPNAKTAPVNVLWGELIENDKYNRGYKESDQKRRYVNIVRELYGSQFEEGLKQGSFGSSARGYFSIENIIKILKLEEKRLGL